MSTYNKFRSTRNSSSIGTKIVIVVLILALIAAGVVIFMLGKNSGDSKNNTNAAKTEQANADTVKKAGKLIKLPDEEPKITEVDNADEIKKQAFFKDVENGDKILIFINNARVVIYRPSSNIIVNSGPIVNDSALETTTNNETKAEE